MALEKQAKIFFKNLIPTFAGQIIFLPSPLIGRALV
jgi:hypothetical protein